MAESIVRGAAARARGRDVHPIIQEVGRTRRTYFNETRREWLERRYEDSIYRERTVISRLQLNRATEDTRQNWRCAYRQACVHRRLSAELSRVIALMRRVLPYDLVDCVLRARFGLAT